MALQLRASMEELVRQARALIGDVAGPSQVFTSQEIQDALDARATVVRGLALAYEATQTSSASSYLDFSASWGWWEDSVVLRSASYATIVPTTKDLIAGHWTFATSQPPPISLDGTTYDLFAAAADLLEQWAAKEPFSIIQNQGQTIVSGGKRTGRLEIAKLYRKRSRPRTAVMVRSDCS